MQLPQAESLARRARGLGWFSDLEGLASSVRTRRAQGRLLVVGHPDGDPWHLAAHLEMLAQTRNLPTLTPTLVRGGRLHDVERSDTVLVVSELKVPDEMLEHLSDARTLGSTVLGLSAGDTELSSVAHEAVSLDLSTLRLGPEWLLPDFELVSHLLSVTAASRRTRSGWLRAHLR